MKGHYSDFLATRDENPDLVRDWTYINTTPMIHCIIDALDSARLRESLTKLSELVTNKSEGFAEFIKGLIPADIPAGESPIGHFVSFTIYVNNTRGRITA